MATPRWNDIFEAVRQDDIESVKYFVEIQKFPLTTKNDDDETAVHIATSHSNLNILKYLLDKKPDLIGVKDVNGNTILYLAVEGGALDIVKYLVDERKMDPHQTNNLRLENSVLHIAAGVGHFSIVKYLVEEKDLDVNLRNALQQPPAFLAALNKHLNIIKYLLENCNADLTVADHNENNILYMSATEGDVSVPQYLLDEKKIDLDVNWRDSHGETITHRAARFNHLNFLKYVIEEKHADFNLRDHHGRTPLHEATTKSNMPIIKYLIQAGADTEIRDLHGMTPLRVAIDQDVINYLTEVLHKRNQRSRRNVKETLACPQNVWRLNPIISGQLESKTGSWLARISLQQLNRFLLLASLFFGHSKGFSHKCTESLIQSSPQEIILDRMDPKALDGINAVDEFER